MSMGSRIKEARLKKGLRQDELAALVGVQPSAISNYESDTSRPRENVLYKLFETLDVDANFLYQDMMPQKTEPERRIELETLAAHRTNGYDEPLSQDVLDELEVLLAYLRSKYKKK